MLLLCALLGTSPEPAAAEPGMRLFLHFDAATDALVLSLANMGTEERTVDGRLALGPEGNKAVEVTIEIIDDKGRRHPFAGKLKIGWPTAHDLVELSPDATLGRVFRISWLSAAFNLKPNVQYRVRARYRGRYDGSAPQNRHVFRGMLTSPWVTFLTR